MNFTKSTRVLDNGDDPGKVRKSKLSANSRGFATRDCDPGKRKAIPVGSEIVDVLLQ